MRKQCLYILKALYDEVMIINFEIQEVCCGLGGEWRSSALTPTISNPLCIYSQLIIIYDHIRIYKII